MKMKKIATGVGVAAMSVVMMVKAHACDPHGFHDEGKMEARMIHIKEALKLNDSQAEIMTNTFSELQQQFTNLRDVRKEIKTMVESESYNEAELRTKAQAMANQLVESIVSHGAEMHELYNSLNEEQRQKLAQLEENHKRRHGEFGPH
jgi:Spy/CpxP family protein refolding chaperone